MLKNKTDKFKHLNMLDPKAGNILKLPVEDISNKHLGILRSNLSEYSNHKNPEIAEAAFIVIKKIDKIVSLWNKIISSEILNATIGDSDEKLAA